MQAFSLLFLLCFLISCVTLVVLWFSLISLPSSSFWPHTSSRSSCYYLLRSSHLTLSLYFVPFPLSCGLLSVYFSLILFPLLFCLLPSYFPRLFFFYFCSLSSVSFSPFLDFFLSTSYIFDSTLLTLCFCSMITSYCIFSPSSSPNLSYIPPLPSDVLFIFAHRYFFPPDFFCFSFFNLKHC